MDLHDQVECIRLAVSERASQLGFSNGDEVIIELQTQVNLDVCVSRDEPNLERALQAAFERYRQRLSVEAIFELIADAGSSGSASRVLLKPAISFAPVVSKSTRDRCDSLARNAESATGASPRTDTATTAVRAVLVPSLGAHTAEAESETQSKKDSNGNTSQRGDRRGNRKSKQAQAAEEEVRPAKRDLSPAPTAIDGLLDILRLTRPARTGQGKAKNARLSGTPQRTVVGCSLLLEMYKRGAVGLSFKLKSGAHDHAALRVHLCVALPVRFVEPPAPEMSDSLSISASTSTPAAQLGAADESVYGAYPFDRSVTTPDSADGDQPPDENERQDDTEDERAVREDVSITELYEALREATIRQLELAYQFAARFSKLTGVSDSEDVPLFELTEPAAFVFRLPHPKDSVNYVSVMYPADVARDAEAPFRQLRTELHSALGLSMDRPALRRAQAAFPSRQDAAVVGDDGLIQIAVGNSNSNAPRRTCGLLPNVHCGVLTNEQNSQTQKTELQPRLGLKRAFVRGDYAYFHYVCDGFEDSNWGCAYRSLQTLISWYILNGWTRIGVPTLTEIQRALVACGDQEASLVGSRRWIGSTEVGLALQTLLAADGLDITYKILFVARGSELSSHVRALLAHFELIGTPVMIGGGQYAHTIVGAEFDEMQGRTRFMIVDPHYVGPETLPTVLKKGWCAWRDPATFFNDTTFYNLCMPQLPTSL